MRPLKSKAGIMTICQTPAYMVQTGKETIWLEKEEYSYDDNKILSKIKEILEEKRIIIC